MSERIVTDLRWLRSRPTGAGLKAGNIDREAGIVRDVVVAQTGEAKGHGVHLDEEFIADLVAYDKQNFGDRGVKARFGHPGASDNTMGMQMGYFRNARKRKMGDVTQAIADLHLLDSADLSPSKPNMREWVMKMAEEAPDFIMSSIVFQAGGYYQKKGNGHKVPLEDGYPDEALGNVYVAMGQHHFTDLVEDGAATDNLFAAQVNPHFFISQVEDFLQSYPQLLEFSQKNPEKVEAFLRRIGVQINTMEKETPKPSALQRFFSAFTDADATDLKAEITALQTQLSTANTEKSDANARAESLSAEVATLTQSSQALRDEVTQLKADLATAQKRVTALESETGEKHTDGDTDTEGGKKVKDAKWQAFRAKHNL